MKKNVKGFEAQTHNLWVLEEIEFLKLKPVTADKKFMAGLIQ